MPAWTDLRMIDVCPFHRCWLLSRCQACNRSLDWTRPSLLTCLCGAKLSHTASEAASDEHCRLARSFVRLIQGETLDSQCVSLSEFPDITLERLLGLSKAVASLHFAATRGSSLSECQRAARMFAVWPASLSQAVDILVAGSTEEIEHGGTQLGKIAYTANKQLLRVNDIRDLSTLRKLLAACVPGDLRSAKEALHVEPRAHVERKASARPCKKNSQKVPVPGILRVRRAAERLGMPVRVLKSLRQTGHFEILYPARWSAAYSVEDVVRFEKRVAELPLFPCSSHQSIALRNLVTKQVRGDGKARIFAAVLERSIVANGRTGPLLTDLEVEVKTAEAMWNSIRQVANGGTINCSEAATSIGCHFHDIGSLCRRGFVRGYKRGRHLRIYADAPAAFKQEYALIKEIAGAVGTSASKALAVAISLGLDLFRDDVWPDRLAVIRRQDAAKLHECLQNER